MVINKSTKISNENQGSTSGKKKRWLLVATDGTDSTTGYNVTYKTKSGKMKINFSFVKKFYLASKLGRDERLFMEGPNTSGLNMTDLRDKAIDWLKPRIENVKYDSKIVLVGHSRGGMLSILLANWLQERNVNVEYMGLYDAVDRTPNVEAGKKRAAVGAAIGLATGAGASAVASVGFLSGFFSTEGMNADVIPSNVLSHRHAIRDPSLGSRWWFGNTGMMQANGKKAEMKTFIATHGAMGGSVPHDCEEAWLETFVNDSCKSGSGGISEIENTKNAEVAHRWIVEGSQKIGFPVTTT